MRRNGANDAVAPGRVCPLHYRYSPSVFRQPALLETDTAYVIGGLYGNAQALAAIMAMRRAERRRVGDIALIFNGDFNWFNADEPGLRAINEAVLEHAAIQGNVEAELSAPDAEAGCGCAYPGHVAADVVDASNRIMTRLHACAAGLPALRARLQHLPRYACVRIGDQRIGIVHGDPASLAGWNLAAENLQDNALREAQSRRLRTIAGYFRESGVLAFCSSHTCLPVMRDFRVDGRKRLVANNGAAGMPNFRGTRCGLLTRVSVHGRPPDTSLYGISLGGLRFDAVPVHYDQQAWLSRFLGNWPQGSPAYRSYYGRLLHGPEFGVEQAALGSVTPAR